LLVKWSSAEIATQCNRVFAQETVVETFRDTGDQFRIYLSRWPVVVSDEFPFVVEEDGVELVIDEDYELDLEKGRLTRFNMVWSEPVVVSYTGGYDLPQKAPLALRQAALLMSRQAYFAAIRG